MAPDEDVIARLVRKTLYIGALRLHHRQLQQPRADRLQLVRRARPRSRRRHPEPGAAIAAGPARPDRHHAGQPILAAISSLTGFVAFFDNFIQIAILLLAWLIVVISFFVMAIQLFVSLIEFKLTTLAGFVLVPFGLFGRTAFLAEKVLGNVVSSGVKILVLAVIVGIGSTIFGQFTTGFNNPPTISDALTLILAALSLLGLSIFGPGIANGLIAGGPQLGAGAAVRDGSCRRRAWGPPAPSALGAAGGVAAAGVARRRFRRRRRGRRLPRGRRREGSSSPVSRPAPAVSPRKGRWRRSARCAAPRHPSRSVSRPGGSGGAGVADRRFVSTGLGEPTWAARMRRRQTAAHGASAASHALRSGDQPSSGTSVDLSEE